MNSETPITDAATHDELDRLLKIETAARQWWKAKGRHNSQIAACKLGEALGHPVTWPAGYIPADTEGL